MYFYTFDFKQVLYIVDYVDISKYYSLSFHFGLTHICLSGNRKMANEILDNSKYVKDITTLLIGFGSLIVADNGVLRFLFGIILLLFLIKYLREPCPIWDRVIVGMSMSFALIIASSYFLTSFLNTHGWSLFEDKVLIIEWVVAAILFYALKWKLERPKIGGET